MMVHIHFEPKDRQTFQFRKTTNKLASFLIKNNEYLRLFVHFLRDSYAYDANKFHQMIHCYQEKVSRKRVQSGFDEEYVSLLDELSTVCHKDSDVNDLRGMIAEQIFQECFRKKKLGRDWLCSTGCSVWIDGIVVIYKAGDESKMTVDLGAWCFNLQSGKFYEVKLSPYAFHPLDFGYLALLHDSLRDAGVSLYEIGIFSLDNAHLLQNRIQQLGYKLLPQMHILSLDDFLKNESISCHRA